MAYLEKWQRRTQELIDKYRPDLLYFDGPMPVVCSSDACAKARATLEKYGLSIAAHFYNENQKWHDGKLEAVLNLKSWGPGTIPNENVIVLDVEKGQSGELRGHPWQTDTSLIGPWFYAPEPLELSDVVVVHNLCDIVSKNGNLLLNVGLKADGTLSGDQMQVLVGIGNWLEQNGEAIYGTRPWKCYGEGPTAVAEGHFKQNTAAFTAQDIRFTTKGNTLYAILLGWPEDGRVLIHSLPASEKLWFGEIASIDLIGSDEKPEWKRDPAGLAVKLPEIRPGRYAYVLRVTGRAR